jgi:succinoglycan biosynthesis transport protein ExoP
VTLALPADEGPDRELRTYVAVAWRRKSIILLAIILCGLLGYTLSSRSTKIYEGQADLLLSSGDQFGVQSSPGLDSTAIGTQLEVLKSLPVQDGAVTILGEQRAKGITDVSVASVGTTRLVRITVKAFDPNLAADGANAYAKAFIDYRVQQTRSTVDELASQVQPKIDAAKRDIDAIDKRIAATSQSNATAISDLRDDRRDLTNQISALTQVVSQRQLDASLQQGGASLLSGAVPMTVPVSPQPKRTVILGSVLGLLIGLALAFARDLLGDRIEDPNDLARAAAPIPMLGALPSLGDGRRRENRLVTVHAPSSAPAEAFRTLRTSLQFVGLREPLRTLLVTSPMPGEGKSTTAANLAVSFAAAGRSVVIVGADLRNPTVHELFGLSNGVGLTSVLLGEVNLEAAIDRIAIDDMGTSIELLKSGPLPPNPSELLGSTAFQDLLNALRMRADLVVLDSSPLVPVSDSLVLSQWVDGVMLVLRPGVTRRRTLTQALQLASSAHVNMVGVVMNDAQLFEFGYGAYGGKPPNPKRRSRGQDAMPSSRRSRVEQTL